MNDTPAETQAATLTDAIASWNRERTSEELLDFIHTKHFAILANEVE